MPLTCGELDSNNRFVQLLRWSPCAHPTGQVPGDLKWACLCSPEARSSLTSTLEILSCKEAVGLVVGSEDTH
ncbi:UNVERIFIED_CONTAM: hypothetical protein FKN15_048585 [Acipenser sinensis]